jgi:hypothetical protein
MTDDQTLWLKTETALLPPEKSTVDAGRATRSVTKFPNGSWIVVSLALIALLIVIADYIAALEGLG